MFSKLVTSIGAVLLVVGAAQGVAAQEHEGPGLTGTWHVTVTLRDCTTGTPRPPFQSLLTFGEDGTLVESTNNQAFQPGQRTSGHGEWRRTGHRAYSAYSDAFILFSSAPSLTPPSPGFTRGLQRITQDITLDPKHDEFSAVANVQFFDDGGTLLLQACATAAGRR